MSKLTNISSTEFDSIVPVDDLCIAVGLVCTSQRRALRHYALPDGRELTVNTARNEWAMKNPDCYGTASQLAQQFGLAENGDFFATMQIIDVLYLKRTGVPSMYPTAALSVPVSGFTRDKNIVTSELDFLMTQLGISLKTLSRYAEEGSVPKAKGRGQERVLALPAGEHGYIGFNGNCYRCIGDGGMTSFGERRKNQICMVYENSLDFLALMEQVERNGVHPSMARRYHIILNGKWGLHEACEYLKANPDLLDVRCFMPENEFGNKAFAAINDAVKGTAVNRSEMYHGFGSLLGKYLPKVPEAYRKWKASLVAQSTRIEESEKRDVRQEQPEKVIDVTPLLGGEKNTMIDRETGGLKL